MAIGLVLTTGAGLTPLPANVMQWLVEARIEMELSKPSRFALRFEDDICDSKHEIRDSKIFTKDLLIGLFTTVSDVTECLVYGPVTKLRTSSMLGGPGSWIEVQGEDRRVEMGRVGIQSAFVGKASSAIEQIVGGYQFLPKVQATIITHDKQKLQLTQSGTDLDFIEDAARRNNMEFWLSYAVVTTPTGGIAKVEETAHFATSPHRETPGDIKTAVPVIPPLLPQNPAQELRVNPPDQCANVTKFDARINFTRPTSAAGFTLGGSSGKAVASGIVAENSAAPVDSDRPPLVEGAERKYIAPPQTTDEDRFLALDAIVTEASWFVEVDCSATLDQLGFLLRPHQVVAVTHAGPGLSGNYQVMKVTHVLNASDHLMDCTVRANGVGTA